MTILNALAVKSIRYTFEDAKAGGQFAENPPAPLEDLTFGELHANEPNVLYPIFPINGMWLQVNGVDEDIIVGNGSLYQPVANGIGVPLYFDDADKKYYEGGALIEFVGNTIVIESNDIDLNSISNAKTFRELRIAARGYRDAMLNNNTIPKVYISSRKNYVDPVVYSDPVTLVSDADGYFYYNIRDARIGTTAVPPARIWRVKITWANKYDITALQNQLRSINELFAISLILDKDLSNK